jgi:hypothetical protein
MYSVDFKKLVLLLLPTFLRKPVLPAFLKAAITPMAEIHRRFLTLKKEWDYRLNHDGKVWSLEKVLNDKFDSFLRRIYITDTEYQDDVYVGNRDNREQVHVSSGEDDGSTIHIGVAPQYLQRADFIVHLPHLLLSEEIAIKNTIDTYKIAGKTYILIFKVM